MQKSKKLWLVVLIISIVVFLFAATFFAVNLLGFGSGNDVSSGAYSDDMSESSGELPENPVNFSELWKQNSDICGWIKVSGLPKIDYPILQCSTDEEGYYLDHNVNRESRQSGSIFIEMANNEKFTDPNTVIYGHDMLNGSMFATLKKFRKADFFNENTTITICIPEHVLTYTIVSAFVYDDRHILNSFDFNKETDYSLFLEDVLDPASMVRNVREGMNVSTNARIITLSTCTGRETERYLVVGVLTDDKQTK